MYLRHHIKTNSHIQSSYLLLFFNKRCLSFSVIIEFGVINIKIEVAVLHKTLKITNLLESYKRKSNTRRQKQANGELTKNGRQNINLENGVLIIGKFQLKQTARRFIWLHIVEKHVNDTFCTPSSIQYCRRTLCPIQCKIG